MFGHDDHDDHNENNQPEDGHQHDGQPAEDVVQPDSPAGDDWQHPGPPPADDDGADDNDGQDDKPQESEPETHDSPSSHFSLGSDSDSDSDAGDSHGADNELIDLKREVLGKLSPLVGHLEQNPYEKFRTLMMMIQASDDQGLVREAYETALKIDDEKERAQALLDIVNEINYFTQNSDKDAN